MREIKFRQRNKNNGQYYYWGIVDGSWFDPIDQDNFTNREESEQYTGLKDKNGKEIFEFDSVKVDFWEFKNHKRIKYYETGIIKWFDWKCGWMLETGKDRFIDLFIGEFHFEVIGNIYENKELIGVKHGTSRKTRKI